VPTKTSDITRLEWS